jgi:hypothetical protein
MFGIGKKAAPALTAEQKEWLAGQMNESIERVAPRIKEIESEFFGRIHLAVEAQRQGNVTAPFDPSKFDERGARIQKEYGHERDTLGRSIGLQEQRAELLAAPAPDYKALYEVVAAQEREVLDQLRFAAIREERVQRMMQMIEARTGARVTTDSQGNVLVISPDGETTMLPTGFTSHAKALAQ